MTTQTKKQLKVVANIREIILPEYEASFDCPHCKRKNYIEDVDDFNITVTHKCVGCNQKFKVKIPHF